MLDGLRHELHDAARGLRRAPLVGLSAVVLIAFAIGVNATVYSVADGFIRRPAPGVPDTLPLVMLQHVANGRVDPATSYPNFLDYAAQSRTLDRVFARAAAIERLAVTRDDGRELEDLRGATVSANYFEALGLRFAAGRPFSASEAGLDGSGLVAVISHRVWQQQFDGAVDIAGRAITVNGRPATIVGVAPPRFLGLTIADQIDMWMPLLAYARVTGTDADLTRRTMNGNRWAVGVYGRLAPGATLAQVRAEFATLSRHLQADHPDANKNVSVVVQTYSAGAGPGRDQQAMLFTVLKVTVLMVLFVVGANVANMMVLRSVSRQREFALRQALGASRPRIVRTLICEGLILSAAAWVGGCLFSFWASRVALTLIPHASADLIDFSPDATTVAYGGLLALLSTVVSTTVPALRVLRGQLVDPLKASSINTVGRRSRLPIALATAQLAVSFALLANFGLVRGAVSGLDALGVDSRYGNLLLAHVLTQQAASSPAQNSLLLSRLAERIAAIPGVAGVSYSQRPPTQADPLGPVRADVSQQPLRALANRVGPGYLTIVGVQGLQGRDLSDADRDGAPKTAVINDNLARSLTSSGPVLGRSIVVGDDALQVVGVAPNGILPSFPYGTEFNLVFLPERQHPFAARGAVLYIRHGAGTGLTVGRAVRQAIADVDRRVQIMTLQTMPKQLESVVGPLPFIAALLLVLAVGAFAVASVGLFTVVAYNISTRIREFGVRLALGSSPRGLVLAELARGARVITIGGVVGFMLSTAVTRLLRGIVVGIGVANHATVVAHVVAFVLLSGMTLLAYYVPSRRAATMDAMQTLRTE
jgi:predicted permease